MYNICKNNGKERAAVAKVYLDNSATTAVSKGVCDKISYMLTQNYGNPSSLHDKGLQAEQSVEAARASIAKMLGCSKNEIFFTSGGTESNNLAVFGAALKNKKRGNKIVTTKIEHSSVDEPMKELERQGFEIVYLQPDKYGMITKNQLISAIDEKTILVSMMMVNNEVGSILPVADVKNCIKAKGSPAIFHVDAVQAFGKIPVKASKIGADLITVTAHKIHGPKGVGALYKSSKVTILPRTFGGSQQQKLRPGTEPVPLIVGFGAAVDEASKMQENYNHVKEVRDYLVSELKKFDEITMNSSDDAIPYITNFSIDKIKSETMLHFLSAMGIYVSSGSACAKGQKSRVLTSLNLPDSVVDSALRVSFSKHSTIDDANELLKGIRAGINRLAKY